MVQHDLSAPLELTRIQSPHASLALPLTRILNLWYGTRPFNEKDTSSTSAIGHCVIFVVCSTTCPCVTCTNRTTGTSTTFVSVVCLRNLCSSSESWESASALQQGCWRLPPSSATAEPSQFPAPSEPPAPVWAQQQANEQPCPRNSRKNYARFFE